MPGSNKTVLIKDNGVYTNGQLQVAPVEDITGEQSTIEIPEYEYADDGPYNPDNLYGIHTKVGDSSVTLEVSELFDGYYTFIVTYGTGDDDYISFNPDAGAL